MLGSVSRLCLCAKSSKLLHKPWFGDFQSPRALVCIRVRRAFENFSIGNIKLFASRGAL